MTCMTKALPLKSCIFSIVTDRPPVLFINYRLYFPPFALTLGSIFSILTCYYVYPKFYISTLKVLTKSLFKWFATYEIKHRQNLERDSGVTTFSAGKCSEQNPGSL